MSDQAPPKTVRRELRETRDRARLAKAKLELKQWERAQRLTESSLDWGWVGQYRDMYDRWRGSVGEIGPGLPANAGDRNRGNNWPLFQTEQELAILRGASRVMASTNDYALGLMNGLSAYVVGSGFTYRATPRSTAQSQIDQPTLDAICAAVDQCLEEFHERSEWFGGEQPGMEIELLERWITDGEFLCRQWAMEDGGTEIRTVEPERLTTPPGADQREWSYGIRTEPQDTQIPLGYWIFDGDTAADGEEFAPDDVTHCRKNVPRSVKRGLPDFAYGTYDALEQAQRLRTNMTEGAAVQAAIAWIEQHESATAEDISDLRSLMADYTTTDPRTGRTENVTRYKPGSVVDVNKGRVFTPSPISQALQSLVPILEAGLRGAGRRWNAPQWLCSGDNSSVNFASSLTSESPFLRTVVREQGRLKVVFTRIHEVALRNRCEAGQLIAAGRAWDWRTLRRLVQIECSAPSPETRDKLQESQRRQIENTAGAYSVQQWCADEGRDYDQTCQEIEEHRDRMGVTGEPLPMPGEQP